MAFNIIVIVKDRLNGLDMDLLWKSTKKAKEEDEALKAVQNTTRTKTKSKLKAAIEKEDATLRNATRKVPKYEKEEAHNKASR